MGKLLERNGVPVATKNLKKKPVWEMTKEEQKNDTDVVFDFDELLEFAEGDIGPVFGPKFSIIDNYSRRVRLPAREYLLVSRVTKMDAEPNQFRIGATMTTEYDLPVNGELSEGGDIPWAILVESGQCDLMLISYMGIDFQCKGNRVYRLLDTTLTFYGVAYEGETLTYDIKVNGFAKGPGGEVSMFFFSYDCYCNGRLLIEMRNGAAGFFDDETLAQGKGVIHTKGDLLKRSKIVKQDVKPFMVEPCTHKTKFTEADMQALVDKKWDQVMGRNYFLDYKLTTKKMLMIDRVTHIIPNGGAYGLGLLIGEKILDPDHWYFPCHFVKDQVMAGSLVSDGCSQLLKLYMVWLGFLNKVEPDFKFVPVDGTANKVRCRGQISPHKGKLVYVMEVRELGYDSNNNPYAVADVDIIDVHTELGQTFNFDELDQYGRGDLSKKIVVDFKGIALRMKGTPRDARPSASASSSTAVWEHPMAKIPGNPTPSFTPSPYPPRPVCFTPFPNNPLDKNSVPGQIPLNWFNMSEFMCGKVSACLGDEFKRFDNSKTSRSPAFDLALVTRVTEVKDLEHGKFYNVDLNPSKGTMVAEFDCPRDAWFYKGMSHDSHIPYSIIMEIGLQTSGVLTSWVKAPLTMDKDDILFRNLDATAELIKDIDVRGKTIKNVSKCTGYNMLGKMGIHRFTFELSVDGEPFYKGSTSFGWFVPEVFASQVGLDNGKVMKPWYLENKVPAAAITTFQSVDKPAGVQKLVAKQPSMQRRSFQCQFLDTVNIIPGNYGMHGKGYAHGKKTVNKNDWFFSCHFWMDPVMPGSLGIESMFQLIESFIINTDLASKNSITNPKITHTPGETKWKYRGQLSPKSKQMDSEVHIKEVQKQPDGSLIVVADGYLLVDGLRVYFAESLRVRIESGSQQPMRTESIGSESPLSVEQLREKLLNLSSPVRLATKPNGQLVQTTSGGEEIAPVTIADLGDKSFMETYGVVAPMYTGAMAKGIASADLVIAAGKKGILGSFGAGGLPMHIVKESLAKIQAALPNGPYAVNLIHSPFDSNLEEGNVDLFLEKGVHVIEASAFMDLTPQVVRYRAAGLKRGANGEVVITNRIIGKCSRTELAEMFIRPAPEKLLRKLVQTGKITEDQAAMAKTIPMADDVAVEADSGGHTDNRPLHVILPLIINLRNRIHKECGYPDSLRVRVGAGGGIGCPSAALAAYNMGAAFIITGTINQVCRQSGTCDNVRKALSQASYSDITMAPAADMFDQGVELQVLKKGTMFPSRAKKLYELFCKYNSFDEMPVDEVKRLEKRTFRKTVAEVWEETKDFYINRLHNPDKIERAEKDGKLKMSLCFRWYLGLSSFWANNGIEDRVMDYQVWCGPAIGAFNDFVKGTYLDVAHPSSNGQFPCVVQANMQILTGACYLDRVNQVKSKRKLDIDTTDATLFSYKPDSPIQ